MQQWQWLQADPGVQQQQRQWLQADPGVQQQRQVRGSRPHRVWSSLWAYSLSWVDMCQPGRL